MEKLYCEKCGSEDVTEVCIDPPPEPKRVSIADYNPQRFQVVPAIMRYSHHRATCKACGNSKEYTF